MDVTAVLDEGLGNSAYLVDLGDGRALAVDASRDLRSLRVAAERRHLSIAYAADTHLHADFLSGAVQLAATDGARILASRAGGRQFPHVALADGDAVDLGGLTLRALETPGHTHEHLSFELLDGGQALGVFTGGSLLVGSAARTDLVSPDRTEDLARAQYRSLRRLTELADDVAVWPTHGAGSFCSAPPGRERTSTIGVERATNTLLGAQDEDAFVRQLLSSLGSFPPYFRLLGEINRVGPPLVSGDTMPALPAPDLARLQASGAEVVDVRPAADFATAHVPGSLSIPLRPVFATWLGWLVPAGTSLAIVRNADQDLAEVLWQARKIGYDRVLGELDGGMPGWVTAGQPTTSVRMLSPADLDSGTYADVRVLDVRQDNEFDSGHVAGATGVELGELATRPDLCPAGDTMVMCGHGERAMSAASLLLRLGRRDVTVLAGAPPDVARSTGQPLEVTS